MRIGIPIEQNRGMESLPSLHFGSAPYFMVYDTESGEAKIIRNEDQVHAHGTCHPMSALTGEVVEAIIAGGIGARAIALLSGLGIKVYRSTKGTARENIDRFKNNDLLELTPGDACGRHDHECK